MFAEAFFLLRTFLFARRREIRMSLNGTEEEEVMVEECEGKETFHIYLLTIVYSLLAVSGSGWGRAGWSTGHGHAERSRFYRL